MVHEQNYPNGTALSLVATSMRPPAASPPHLRHSNLTLILAELVSAHGGLSRSDLAARTGLARPTVSRLTQELIEAGLVVEQISVADGSPGRPGRPLFPASRAVVGIGLEVNVDHVAGAAIDLLGETVDSFVLPIDGVTMSSTEVLDLLGARLRAMVEALTQLGTKEISGITLAVPSVIDGDGKRVIYASNLEWRDLVPYDVLKTYLPDGVPFVVDNDANVQALATASLISTSDAPLDSFLYVFGEYGIGGALVENGKVVRGPNGWYGEIGHMAIDPWGDRCHCGAPGCLETFIGRRLLMEKAGLPEGSTVDDLVHALEEGSYEALSTVHRAGWALGIALANAANLIDLNQVVLGTGLAPLLPWMENEIKKQLDLRLIGRKSDTIAIRPVAIDANLSSIGGALQSLQVRLDSPVP